MLHDAGRPSGAPSLAALADALSERAMAVRACERHAEAHPDDPHAKRLLVAAHGAAARVHRELEAKYPAVSVAVTVDDERELPSIARVRQMLSDDEQCSVRAHRRVARSRVRRAVREAARDRRAGVRYIPPELPWSDEGLGLLGRYVRSLGRAGAGAHTPVLRPQVCSRDAGRPSCRPKGSTGRASDGEDGNTEPPSAAAPGRGRHAVAHLVAALRAVGGPDAVDVTPAGLHARADCPCCGVRWGVRIVHETPSRASAWCAACGARGDKIRAALPGAQGRLFDAGRVRR